MKYEILHGSMMQIVLYCGIVAFMLLPLVKLLILRIGSFLAIMNNAKMI
jgi:hypothetical protein